MPGLDPWDYAIEHLVEIAARLFLEKYGPLMSGLDAFRFDYNQNVALLSRYVRHWDEIAATVAKLKAHGYALPGTTGRFSVEFINDQRFLYGFPSVENWLDPLMLLDMLQGFDVAYSPTWILSLPVWWLPFMHQLLYPPYNELGCIIEHMRQLRTMSMLIDVYRPGQFRHLAGGVLP